MPAEDFTTVLHTYKSLDLTSLQSLLHSLVEPLTALQTNSLTSRKKLAEQTREFKKLKDEEKLESYKPLLKAYQSEIDDLTKRSRDAEGGVRKCEEKLRGVMDPYVVLEKVLDQMAGSVSDTEKLKHESVQLQKENSDLQGKMESTTSALQADRDQMAERLAALQGNFEKDLAEAKESVESEVTARFDERLSNATARENELSRSLALAQEQLKQLRTSHETTTERLLSSTSSSSANSSTHGSRPTAELDMLSQDLQRSNERIATIEKRNEQLREEIERVKSGRSELGTIEKLQSKLRSVEDEKAKLQSLLSAEEQARTTDQSSHQASLKALQHQLDQRSEELASLRSKLDSQADYEEIKRELGIIRYVEFSNGLDDDEEDDAANQLDSSSSSTATAAKPLEALLLQKNKKLQEDLTTLRVAHSELTQQSSTSLVERQKAKDQVDHLTKLVQKLENDLLEVGASTGGAGSNVQNVPMSAEEALDELDKLGKGESLPASTSKTPATKSSSTNGTSAPAQTSSSPAAPPPKSNDSSVLPIIVSQRDRFRTRNAELEEELRKQFELITSLRSEIKTLQSDNLSLYEKVRYLQSYSSSSSSASASAPAHVSRFGSSSSGPVAAAAARSDYPPTSQHTKVPMNIASGGSDDKYRARYEQSMNPFEAFRGREQSRAMSSLNPLEKLLHMISTVILKDRRMRIGFMVYAVGMHLFIFAILLDYTFFGTSGGAVAAPGTNCAAPIEPAAR